MEIFDFIFQIDSYLASTIALFGVWTYVILFGVIFAETGVVVMPFLPGDSLLFAVGTLAGAGLLDIWVVYFVMLVAAILGDAVNYWIGKHVGLRVFSKENARFFKQEHLEKTRGFYERHGGRTIIIARFLPIIRTFAPFVAGIGRMKYRTFFIYNVVGAFLWVTSLTFAGFYFGGMPFVQANFEYVIFGIIIISLLPLLVEYVKHKREPKVSTEKLEGTTYEEIQETFKKEHLKD
jgi:membrane-associated protein